MRRTRLRSRSKKRTAMAYGEFVAARLAISNRCEVGRVIAHWDSTHRCSKRATGLHHLRKRSASGRIVSRLNTRRCCDPCNSWVEKEPRLARLAGLVVREGDAWWPWLGRRLPSGRKLGA